jgi:hypothetical protein
MGIPLKLEYRPAQWSTCHFHLRGTRWSVSFRGEHHLDDGRMWPEGIEALIGPLEEAAGLRFNVFNRPIMTSIFLMKFKQRGKRERFLHDMSLIRLTL